MLRMFHRARPNMVRGSRGSRPRAGRPHLEVKIPRAAAGFFSARERPRQRGAREASFTAPSTRLRARENPKFGPEFWQRGSQRLEFRLVFGRALIVRSDGSFRETINFDGSSEHREILFINIHDNEDNKKQVLLLFHQVPLRVDVAHPFRIHL